MTVSTMAQEILSDLELRSNYALSLINPTRTDPGGPSFPLNLRDGVRACLQLWEYLTKAIRLAFQESFDSRLDDFNATGEVCLLGFTVALKTIRAVENSLDKALQEGKLGGVDSYFEEEIAKLKETIPTLERARADFQHRWPWHDELSPG